MNLFLFIQANAEDLIAEEMVEGAEKSMNLFEMAKAGGIIMLPLVLLSVIAVYIFFERYMAIRRASKEDAGFMNKIKDYIHDERNDVLLI